MADGQAYTLPRSLVLPIGRLIYQSLIYQSPNSHGPGVGMVLIGSILMPIICHILMYLNFRGKNNQNR